jgi:hypothetical protein
MTMKPLPERLRDIQDAQADYQLLCEMWNRREDHCGVTGDDLSEARRNIDLTIRESGFFVGPAEGNTWRYRSYMGDGEDPDAEHTEVAV